MVYTECNFILSIWLHTTKEAKLGEATLFAHVSQSLRRSVGTSPTFA